VLVRFGPFALDARRRQLLLGVEEVHLSPKAFALLLALVEARPSALSKLEIQSRLWPDTFVDEGNLSVLVAEIRAALADMARAPRFIRTVHGFGYAFCADTTTDNAARAAKGGRAWLTWQGGRVPLADGENVLGRDPDASAWLDSPGVSRRHACVRLNGSEAVLEDLGSKNGTYIGDARVTSAVRLADGDRIRVGSMLVTFRLSAGGRSTRTLAP
jgi:DNA-binding winged helix-turn-helix (wHTH) protein